MLGYFPNLVRLRLEFAMVSVHMLPISVAVYFNGLLGEALMVTLRPIKWILSDTPPKSFIQYKPDPYPCCPCRHCMRFRAAQIYPTYVPTYAGLNEEPYVQTGQFPSHEF